MEVSEYVNMGFALGFINGVIRFLPKVPKTGTSYYFDRVDQKYYIDELFEIWHGKSSIDHFTKAAIEVIMSATT